LHGVSNAVADGDFGDASANGFDDTGGFHPGMKGRGSG
jgi:hypothetical protein